MKTVSAVAAIVLCCILAVKGATLDLTLSLQAFVQGIVEGVTEFLPISSTGHMIIVDSFFPMKDEAFAKLFEVVIQLGAILSVLVYFYRTIFPQKWNVEGFKAMIPLWSRVVVGVIPAAVIGFLLDDFIEAHLFNIVVVSVALVVWGVALVFSGRLEKRESSTPEIVKMSYGKALAVGFFQCLAMVPGTSRSAVTILGAMCPGCSRACAAEFSFFLAIPTMFGASLLKLVKVVHGLCEEARFQALRLVQDRARPHPARPVLLRRGVSLIHTRQNAGRPDRHTIFFPLPIRDDVLSRSLMRDGLQMPRETCKK